MGGSSAPSTTGIVTAKPGSPVAGGNGGASSSSSSGAGPGYGGCKNGALMNRFGIFLQGLLGVVAFSTLMRA
ncbi:UNVERIFIED_CONTAM: hypothetical protein K2H54_044890 [Gekko kuhli]